MSSCDMYIALHHNGVHPTCTCGCGERLKYKGPKHGFGMYKRGHISRVKNSYQQPHIVKKSQEARRRMWSRGDLTMWNKGLTKETDERVASYGKKVSETFQNDEERRERYSSIMRENRLNGTIPTLRGADHSQWKGGTSTVGGLVRCRRTFREWHDARRAECDNRCTDCGIHEADVSNSTLDVHHDDERFADIVNRFASMMNPHGLDDFDLMSRIADAVAAYHLDAGVSGVALCRDCHRKLHASLNFEEQSSIQ